MCHIYGVGAAVRSCFLRQTQKSLLLTFLRLIQTVDLWQMVVNYSCVDFIPEITQYHRGGDKRLRGPAAQ